MPELPEVQTTVNGINDEVASLAITEVWTDYNSLFHATKDNIKNPEYFKHFKKMWLVRLLSKQQEKVKTS